MNLPNKRSDSYTKEIGEFICAQLKKGKNLTAICSGNFEGKPMPDRSTVRRWRVNHREFSMEFQEALDDYFWALMDELDDLSRKPAKELYPHLYEKTAEGLIKQRIWAINFLLGKMAQRVTEIFKDKAHVEHSGEVSQVVVQSYASHLAKKEEAKKDPVH